MLISIRMILRALFTQIKHPLAIGPILTLQTIITCIISGSLRQRFSHILFQIFLGGILVLFIYVTRLASNEIFSLSTKISNNYNHINKYKNWIRSGNKETIKHELIIMNETNLLVEKLYN
jgi:hypothetical protein